MGGPGMASTDGAARGFAAQRRLGLAATLLLAGCGLWFPAADAVAPSVLLDACSALAGPVGPEDIEIDRARQVAIVSATDRRTKHANADHADGQHGLGGLFAIDLRRSEPVATRLDTSAAGPLFQPHGISLAPPADGVPTRLFVIDHQPAVDPAGSWDGCSVRQSIKVFDLDDMALRLVRTIVGSDLGDARLINPNDVAALDDRRFFVTQTIDRETCSWWARALVLTQVLFRQARSHVLYFNGREFFRVLDDVGLPNGIVVDPAARRLYVGDTTEGAVRVYGWEIDPKWLTLKAVVRLATGVDNLTRQPDGTLWVAGHADLLTLALYAARLRAGSPSELVRLSPDGARLAIAMPAISAASVVVPVETGGGGVLVGTIFDRLWFCRASEAIVPRSLDPAQGREHVAEGHP